MPNGVCDKCGKHLDDHLCITSKDGLVTKVELERILDDLGANKLRKEISDLEAQVAELTKTARHRVVDVDPVRYECSCGSSFGSFAAFKAHQKEGS